MMTQELNNSFNAIILKKEQFSLLTKDNSNYEKLKLELILLTDDFDKKFGNYLEEIIFNVHDEYCPDNGVLKPLAYIADQYIKKNDRIYFAPADQGVLVQCEDYPNISTRLVLEPNPVKLILHAQDSNLREIVWSYNMT